MPSPPTRRQVLGALSAGLAAGAPGLAGCLDDGSPAPTEADGTPRTAEGSAAGTLKPTGRRTPADADPTSATTADAATADLPTPDLTCRGERLTTPTPDVSAWAELRASETTLGAVANDVVSPAEELRDDQRRVFDRIEGGESVTIRSLRGDRFVDPAFVRADGTYFRVTETQVDERTATVHVFDLAHVMEDDDLWETAQDEAVPFDELSAVDREIFREGLPVGPLAGSGFSTDHAHRFAAGTPPADSRLVSDERTIVAYEDVYVVVRFAGTEQATVRTVEYAASVVARSESAFRETVAETVVVPRGSLDLSSGARELLDHVLDCGHYGETGTYTRELESVREAFADRPTMPGVDWLYVLERDGQYFRFVLNFH